MTACEHPWLRWDLDPTNEAGWVCRDCEHKPGEPPGFSPEADRQHTDEKVSAILFWLHNHELVYVSNGSEGHHIVARVAKRCATEDTYDQTSIVRFICDERDTATYWRGIAQGVLSGNDQRHRCHCGALATCSQFGGGKEPRHTCSEHMRLFTDDLADEKGA